MYMIVLVLKTCRLLVFSPHTITSIKISIDDVPLTSRVEHVEGPLYACLWNPELYSTGLHHITVTAKVSCFKNIFLWVGLETLETVLSSQKSISISLTVFIRFPCKCSVNIVRLVFNESFSINVTIIQACMIESFLCTGQF